MTRPKYLDTFILGQVIFSGSWREEESRKFNTKCFDKFVMIICYKIELQIKNSSNCIRFFLLIEIAIIKY